MVSHLEINKQHEISCTQAEVGWAYHMLNWLDRDEAKRINAEFQKRVSKIAKRGRLSFAKSKLHLGPLSKGCQLCGEGSWSCNFFDTRCNASCFFCPVFKSVEDRPPQALNIPFRNPEEYADFLSLFKYTGSSFSGGEPLLLTTKLASYIKTIKNRFGDSMYVWIYTNGKLINKSRLSLLQQAGLDELRIDIAAIQYNLDPVRLARRYIRTLSVEIPAIPEDHRTLIRLLPKLEQIGIDHLNIHELDVSPANYLNMKKRGYTFLHRTNVTVLESNFAALSTLEYALDKDIHLPINFCTFNYRKKFQSAGMRNRLAPFAIKPYEGITRSGYIRRISMHDVPQRLARLNDRFKSRSFKKTSWSWNKLSNIIDFDPSLVDAINTGSTRRPFFVQYYAPYLSKSSTEDSVEVEVSGSKSVFIQRVAHQPIGPLSSLDLKCFKTLFIDGATPKDITKIRSFDRMTRSEVQEFKYLFTQFEDIADGFAEIF